jgi:hypothetical protein
MSTDLPVPSGAAIMLWVEDPLTRDYLGAVWGNPTWIAFRVAGGNDGVRALVRSFEEQGHPNVFGLVDRDFQSSNNDNWINPAKRFRTFVLPVHEIENYLLDAPALRASRYHNRGLETAAIEAEMLSKARGLCWWAACRDVVAELKRRFREPFLPDPGQTVSDKTEAVRHICGSPWFAKLAAEAGRSGTSDIEKLLDDAFAAAGERIADGSWRQDFAGKEILRHVADRMCDRTRVHGFPSPPAQFYYDLAKQVGAWQFANDAVPPDLINLSTALRSRIPPPATPGGPGASP